MHTQMRILIIHNKYRLLGGEDVVVSNLQSLLTQKGHSVMSYYRSSNELHGMPYGSVRAFFQVYTVSNHDMMCNIF